MRDRHRFEIFRCAKGRRWCGVTRLVAPPTLLPCAATFHVGGRDRGGTGDLRRALDHDHAATGAFRVRSQWIVGGPPGPAAAGAWYCISLYMRRRARRALLCRHLLL